MPLFVYNLTNQPLSLSVPSRISVPVLPPSNLSGYPGKPVNVTTDLIPDLTVDPVGGRSGGLSLREYDGVLSQVSDGDIKFEWASYPEYNSPILASSPVSGEADFVVRKTGGRFNSVYSAVLSAASVASENSPKIINVFPGVYEEENVIEIPNFVHIVGVPGIQPMSAGDASVPTIIGSFLKSGSKTSSLQGIKIIAPADEKCLTVSCDMDWEITNLYLKECLLESSEIEIPSMEMISGYVTCYDCSFYKTGVTGLNISVGPSSDGFIQFLYCSIGYDDDQQSIAVDGGTATFTECSVLGHASAVNGGFLGVYDTWLVTERQDPDNSIELDADSLCFIENSQIDNDGSGGRFSPTGSFSIFGPVYRTVSYSSSNTTNDIPSSGNVEYDCYINKFNADLCLLVKTGSGNVTPHRQNRVIVVNKTLGAPTSVFLPDTPYMGQEHIVIDGKGDANSNNITVSGNGKNINGFPSVTIAANYGRVHLVYNGNQWNIISQTLA